MAKRLGFAEKTRTREKINQEYNTEAVMFGHKSALIMETTTHLEGLQKEVEKHLDAMIRLRKEASTAPAETPPAETKTEDPGVA